MKKLLMIGVFTFLMLIVGCSKTTITPEEAKKLLDSDPNVVLVDVRTKSEYDQERIPKAILLPLQTLKTDAPNRIPDKKITYLIYCRSGNRSADALKLLKDMGYKNVYDLGGIINWPYETIRG